MDKHIVIDILWNHHNIHILITVDLLPIMVDVHHLYHMRDSQFVEMLHINWFLFVFHLYMQIELIVHRHMPHSLYIYILWLDYYLWYW